MTLHAEHQPGTRWTPGTYVYDVCAQAVGRVADPSAYSPEYLGSAVALVVPLSGNNSAWQAAPDCLRLATAAEVEQATQP